jgi:arylsulfatase A-like enzyme
MPLCTMTGMGSFSGLQRSALPRAGLPLLVLLGFIPACLFSSRGPGSHATTGAQPPNVLVIVTDDQPLQTMQVMPNTRQIFRRGGVRFTHAIVTTPSCCPSRASIFTGEYAHNHGIHHNVPIQSFDQAVTIQNYLQQAGYYTAIVGKYLNKWDLSKDPPYFDHWVINPGSPNNRHYFYGSHWRIGNHQRTVHRYSTNFVSDQALSALHEAAASGRPWYLYLAPLAPHADIGVPPFVDKRDQGAPLPLWHKNPAVGERDRSDKPTFVQRITYRPRYARKLRKRQLRSLMPVDRMVARVFRYLRTTHQDGNTLAIFISDNGMLWGDHGLATKLYPYLRSIRVPMYLRWPGKVPAGSTDDRLVANIDIVPTILQAIHYGGALQKPMDGQSLLDKSWRRHRMLAEGWRFAFLRLPNWAATLTKRYEFINYYRGGHTVAHEYYDLTADPGELNNLLGDGKRGNNPDVALLSNRLRRDRHCIGGICP